MTAFDSGELGTIFDQAGGGGDSWSAGILAVAEHVETKTLERVASSDTQVNVLAEIAHQLTRLANASNKPTPTITAEQAIGAWPLKGGMYSHLAVGYLESLGIPVEQEPQQ